MLLAAALACALLGAALAGLGSRDGGLPSAGRDPLAALPLAARGPVSSALGAGQRPFSIRSAGQASFSARNAPQQLSASFTRSGTTIDSLGLRMSLRLRAIGYGSSLQPLGEVVPRARANRVSYAHAGVREWYVNGPLGVEQGFTVARPASAHGELGRAGRQLTLAMALSSNAALSLSSDGQRLQLARGAGRLRYDGLVVTDATGRRLPSHLSLSRGELRIGIDALGARYPLRVDPLVQLAKLTAKEQSGGSNLGQSVAISTDGSTLLVGGPSDEEAGAGEMLVGAAWVFTRTGSSWAQQGPKLRGADRVGEGQFGISVALSGDGNTALIGGINDANVGAAWVFTRSGGKWTQQGGKLTGGGEETGSGRFGKSVALSGDGNTALVGAYFDDGSIGAAWAFKRSGSTWSHYGKKITGAGEGGPGQFGFAVALSTDGKTAMIGGPDDEGSTAEPMAGAAWAFTDTGSGYAEQGAKLTSGGTKGSGELGTSVALSGDGAIALLGAPADGVTGGARAYLRSGATWAQQGAELKPGDATSGAGFGTAVSLSSDATTALIGGPVDADGPVGGGGPMPSGAVWQFGRSGGSWSQQGAKVVGTTSESEFGAAVALAPTGQLAVIGGPIDSTGGVPDAGAFWVYANPASGEPGRETLPPPDRLCAGRSEQRAARGAPDPLERLSSPHALARRQCGGSPERDRGRPLGRGQGEAQGQSASPAARHDVLVHAQRRGEREAHLHPIRDRSKGQRPLRGAG